MNELPINQVICGDCVETMQSFPSSSIDLVITSPPYWGLRDYGVDNQIGLEPRPQLYIEKITSVCREIKRVLKPLGTFWLNLGDTYYGSGGAGGDYNFGGLKEGQPKYRQNSKTRSKWLQPKQLLGIPWRVATTLQEGGWILRNAIVWYKPNHLPSSAKDRLTNTYEFIFLFAKERHYYFDLDSIRKPHKTSSLERALRGDWRGKEGWDEAYLGNPPQGIKHVQGGGTLHPMGKNPGDFWRVSTRAFSGAHFATFPLALIKPIIKAGCPKDGIVLDPFCGSGTVGRVARSLQRKFILIDIKPEYCKMAEQRIRGKYKPISSSQSSLRRAKINIEDSPTDYPIENAMEVRTTSGQT